MQAVLCAHARRDGAPCRNRPVNGSTFCRVHGGNVGMELCQAVTKKNQRCSKPAKIGIYCTLHAHLINPVHVAEENRCRALLKTGARCTRKVKAGLHLCGQHDSLAERGHVVQEVAPVVVAPVA